MGSRDVPYRMHSSKVEWRGVRSPVRTGILRSVGYSHNTFAIESFIDELALKEGIDPVHLRLNLLAPGSRLARCIETAAQAASWKEDDRLGIAACSCFGSHVALVARVDLDRNGHPVLEKMWAAVDCGIQLHPDNILAQVEGGIVFGISATLYGSISVENGAVRESNFHDSPVARQQDVPPIQIELLPSGESPGGVGELAVPVVAPAICNAIARRVKRDRFRSLPLIR